MGKSDNLDAKKACFESLLSEMPWNDLVSVIKFEGKLKKGGFRLNSKNRNVIQANLIPKCLANQELQFSFFKTWFNAKSEYFDLLEPFFNSEKHDELIKNLELENGFYTFDDEYFLKFLKILKANDVEKFIMLSPIHFTEMQKSILLSMASIACDACAGNSSSYQETNLAQQKEIKNELKKYKKTVGTIEKKNKDLYKQMETLQKQLESQKEKYSKIIAHHEMSLRDTEQKIIALEKENEVGNNEIRDIKKLLMSKNIEFQNLEKENGRIKKNGVTVKLSHIFAQVEMQKLLEELQIPDDFRQQLENSVKFSDDDLDADTEISFKSFWESNILLEYELFDLIDNFYTDDVIDKKYFPNWATIKDKFNDLKFSLSSRRYLIDITHRILRQYYETHNLN